MGARGARGDGSEAGRTGGVIAEHLIGLALVAGGTVWLFDYLTRWKA